MMLTHPDVTISATDGPTVAVPVGLIWRIHQASQFGHRREIHRLLTQLLTLAQQATMPTCGFCHRHPISGGIDSHGKPWIGWCCQPCSDAWYDARGVAREGLLARYPQLGRRLVNCIQFLFPHDWLGNQAADPVDALEDTLRRADDHQLADVRNLGVKGRACLRTTFPPDGDRQRA